MKVGYARVSSTGQSLEVQLHKLNKHLCEKIYQEKVSATSNIRPALKECLDYVREGDSLVITKLDRLARSTLDLCILSKKLETKGVSLVVLDQNIDTSSSTGRLLFNMLGAIAQFETEIRAERQADGIARAKTHGVRFGRTKALTVDQVEALKQRRGQGETIKTLMASYKVSRGCLYSYLKEVSLRRS